MISQTRFAAGLALWLVAAVPIPMVAEAGTAAVVSTVPQKSAVQVPVDELEELDEIWVRGRITANRVAATENRVFRLYNRLNKDNRYDVHCGDMGLTRDSMIMTRTCLPNFVIDASLRVSFAGQGRISTDLCVGQNHDHSIGMGQWNHMDPCLAVNRQYGTRDFSYAPSYYAGTTAVSRGTPEQRTMYAENVLRVMQSDPELQEMARGLARMYLEMDRIKARYVKVREDKLAAQKAARAVKTSSTSPRRTAPR
jgi:hypothetical protein